MTNIGFIGLGKLGLPCAEEIARRGHNVKGFDTAIIESELVDVQDNIENCVKDCDIVFVAVPTPHDPNYDGSVPSMDLAPKDFDYTIAKKVLAEADKHMDFSQLLVLISTVLPGTVRNTLVDSINNARFVYNPYLIAMGSVAWDMVNPEMVMIGTESGSETGDARELQNFYETIMENDPRYVIGTWDECECIKIFYNTFISAKLGLVNMIQDVAEKQGNINVDVVTKALADSEMRIMGPQYMTAGMGDGGACHPRDNIALRYMAENLNLGYDLFESIMQAREVQAKNIAYKLVDLATEDKIKDIFIHGKSYKPGVPYTNGSYSLLIGHYVNELGFDVKYIDLLTGDDIAPTEECVVLLAHNSKVTYNYTNSNQESQFYCDIPNGSTILDPWRSFESNNYKVIHYGNTRGNIS